MCMCQYKITTLGLCAPMCSRSWASPPLSSPSSTPASSPPPCPPPWPASSVPPRSSRSVPRPSVCTSVLPVYVSLALDDQCCQCSHSPPCPSVICPPVRLFLNVCPSTALASFDSAPKVFRVCLSVCLNVCLSVRPSAVLDPGLPVFYNTPAFSFTAGERQKFWLEELLLSVFYL